MHETELLDHTLIQSNNEIVPYLVIFEFLDFPEEEENKIIEFLGKMIMDHDPIFFRNTSIKRGS